MYIKYREIKKTGSFEEIKLVGSCSLTLRVKSITTMVTFGRDQKNTSMESTSKSRDKLTHSQVAS